MLFSSRNYAVGYAHYMIAGGTKALALLGSGYIALAALVFGLILYNVPQPDRANAMRAVSLLLLLIQSFGLFLFGSARVAACIRTDLASNMMESHRLMPIASWKVLLSYLLGTTTQIIALLLLNAIMLFIAEQFANVPVAWFIFDGIVLVFLATTLWTFSAMTAFMFRQAMPLIVFGMILGSIGTAIVTRTNLLPALSVLVAPFLGDTVFSIAVGSSMPRAIYALAIPAHIAFACLFFAGACRRFRGTYLSTFNVGMGIALLGLWSLLSIIAIIGSNNAVMRRIERVGLPAQIVAAIVISSLLAIVPAHALAAWEHIRGISPIKITLSLAACIITALAPMFVDFQPAHWALTATVVAFHVIMLHSLYRFTRGMSPVTIGILVVSYFAFIWIGPLALELLRWIITDARREELSILSTFSPLGLLMSAWEAAPGRPTLLIGLIFQAALAMAALRLGRNRMSQLAAAIAAGETPAPVTATTA